MTLSRKEGPCFRIRSSLLQHEFEERTNKSNEDAQLHGQKLVSGCFVFIIMEHA